MSTSLELLSTDAVRVLTWIVVPLALVLAAVACVRARFRPGVVVLELLRLVAIATVLFALHQPERVEVERSDRLPRVRVLWDDSGSMATRDVVPTGATAGARTRAEWVAENLDVDALGAALAGRFRVDGAPLSALLAPEPDPTEDEPDVVGAAEDEDEDGASAREAGTDLAGPLAAALEDPDLRAVVLVGDGDWNVGGNPAEVAMDYRMRGVPILTTVVGSREALPDVELLPLEPPSFALVGKPLAVPIAIRSAMDRDLRVPVTLTDSTGQSVTEEVLLPARDTYEGTLTLTPADVGPLTLTARVEPQPGELDEANNVATAELDVREESLRVLLVESFPRWEYRYLRNAMVRDPGVEVDCFLLHPHLEGVGGGPHYLSAFPSREALSEYDVVFLGDVGVGPDGLSPEQAEDVKGLVAEQASGLILMPGYAGAQLSLADSALAPLLPVELDPGAPDGHGSVVPANLVLTEAGRRSTLTRLAADERESASLWETLPGFQWCAPALRARPGTSVLAVHSSRDDGYGRLPLLATRNYGTGKVLFMGTDGAWRWREGLEDRIHYRFWRQVVRWMAYQRRMNAGETMRLFYSPDRPAVRSLTTLYANVMDAAGAPLSGADVTARVVAPSGRVSRVRFQADDGDWGLYRAAFRALEPGDHEVTLTCAETGERLQATLGVVGQALERVGLPARHDVLAELARVSRGEEFLRTDLARLEERLRALEEPPETIRRTRLWSHPLLGGGLVLVLGAFWIGRKLVGRF